MSTNKRTDSAKAPRGVRRIPRQSLLYRWLLPIAMIGLAILMMAIVIFALGVMLGIIPFK